jgi:hypothetical protein
VRKNGRFDMNTNPKPILFSTPMVRAILDGRKTQTRRVIKFEGNNTVDTSRIPSQAIGINGGYFLFYAAGKETWAYLIKGAYRPGDTLWVRETWRETGTQAEPYAYKVDEEELVLLGETGNVLRTQYRWKPSIHMPRSAARLFLRVTDVRTEQLHNISEADAELEGCRAGDQYITPNGSRAGTARQSFMWLWKRLNDRRDGCSWIENPWVWVYNFEREAETYG